MSLLAPPGPGPAPESSAVDTPRTIDPGRAPADRIFHGTARSVGVFVLLLIGSIGVFLGLQAIPTLRHYGLSFFTESQWNPATDKIGIAAVLIGTVEVAMVAMTFAFPLALSTALFITEYAPPRLKSVLVSLVDLMAAVPSIIWGIWGLFLLEPRAIYVARWLHTYLGWVPFFHVGTDPHAAVWAQYRYTASAFIAGMAVSMMVLPMACAVMRGVFDQAPIGEREAALALGGTRWGVIRSVVIPFGRGGIVGGTMLALGRALGETISVVLILSPDFDIKFRPLEAGSETISALIAGRFGEATSRQLSALLAAGFVLFLITLFTNTIAAMVVNRSRSGAATEI
jgi:phosphate transport system permease protein